MSHMAPATPVVGPRIAALVDESGLSQSEVARRLGMNRSAFHDRLRGRTRWSADELPALAAALGKHPAELLCTVYRHTDGRLCLQAPGHEGNHFPQATAA